MLWVNNPAVIIGKHQNAFAEVNYRFIKEKKIDVVRRISGGGTVYHDPGNLNFTFIATADSNNQVDFNRFTTPIVNALKKLNINVETGKRNSLYIDGCKISGNAEHIYKNKVLHHGTLLFNSDLYALNEAIRPNSNVYSDKAVKSVRSTVTNISEHLTEDISIIEFAGFIRDEILGTYSNCNVYQLTQKDINEINHLVNTKYSSWDWNYGYSPAFNLHTHFRTSSDVIDITLHIKNGIIENIESKGIDNRLSALSKLIGIRFIESEIINTLSGHGLKNISQHIVKLFFEGSQQEHVLSDLYNQSENTTKNIKA